MKFSPGRMIKNSCASVERMLKLPIGCTFQSSGAATALDGVVGDFLERREHRLLHVFTERQDE